jgi:hypothetical protein
VKTDWFHGKPSDRTPARPPAFAQRAARGSVRLGPKASAALTSTGRIQPRRLSARPFVDDPFGGCPLVGQVRAHPFQDAHLRQQDLLGARPERRIDPHRMGQGQDGGIVQSIHGRAQTGYPA